MRWQSACDWLWLFLALVAVLVISVCLPVFRTRIAVVGPGKGVVCASMA